MMRVRRWLRAPLCALLVAPLLVAPVWAVDEIALKAAVVYKLLLFAEWPVDTLQGGSLVLCVGSGSPLNGSLRSLQGQPVGLFKLDVREAAEATLRQCHALFLDALSRSHAALWRLADGAPILLLSDESLAAASPVVRLYVRDERIGFDVDLVQARQRGLRLSSKLLRLAGSVIE